MGLENGYKAAANAMNQSPSLDLSSSSHKMKEIDVDEPNAPRLNDAQLLESKLNTLVSTQKQGVPSKAATSEDAGLKKGADLKADIRQHIKGTRATGLPPIADAGAETNEAEDPLSQIQALPSTPSPPGESRPGAYAETTFARGTNPRIPPAAFSASAASSAHPNIHDNDNDSVLSDPSGLVQARRVSDPVAEEARPVDIKAGVPRTSQEIKRQEKLHSSRMIACLVSCVVLVTVVVGVVVAATVNSKQSQDNQNIPMGDTTAVEEEETTNNATAALRWDVIPGLPHFTYETLRDDINGTSPQYQSYMWVQNDPYLGNYSPARRLQRFALASLYYSTRGEHWTNQGGDLATVFYGLGVNQGSAASEEQQGSGGGGGQGAGAGGGRGNAGSPGNETHRLLQGGGGSDNGIGLSAEQEEATVGATIVSCAGKCNSTGDHDKEKIIKAEKWLSYEHSECEWFIDPSRGPLCGNGSTVVNLDIFNNNLNGTVPPEISLLTDLELLFLHRNAITGRIPTEIGLLAQLISLSLRGNDMTGQLPAELGDLLNLQEFPALNNNYIGPVPTQLLRLPKLRVLMLMGNKLSGTIPDDIGLHLQSIEHFMFGRNKHLSGTLPTSLGLCTSLLWLTVDDNKMTGSIPSQLGLIKNLTKVKLSKNRLTGTIPSEVGLLPLQEILFTGNRHLTGALPTELGLLNGTLKSLDMHGTGLTGTIPETLCSTEILRFDCSDVLCGCGCPCSSVLNNSNLP